MNDDVAFCGRAGPRVCDSRNTGCLDKVARGNETFYALGDENDQGSTRWWCHGHSLSPSHARGDD
jgi:hypothetical protein